MKEVAKKDLVDTLNSVNGGKTLVLDASLAGPLGLVTEVSLLKVIPSNKVQSYTRLKTKTIPRRGQDVLARTWSWVHSPLRPLISYICVYRGSGMSK